MYLFNITLIDVFFPTNVKWCVFSSINFISFKKKISKDASFHNDVFFHHKKLYRLFKSYLSFKDVSFYSKNYIYI